MDLVEFSGRREGRFRLVVAADVFVCLGDLEPIFGAVAGIMDPGGFFIFSVESVGDEESGYVLQKTGRYAHSTQYIEELSGLHGLVVEDVVPARIRKEKGEWIQGACFVLQYPEG